VTLVPICRANRRLKWFGLNPTARASTATVGADDESRSRPAASATAGCTTLAGVVEVHLRKGDALLFCDGLSHGASTRTNPGERRAVIYRYGPTWATTRYGYTYSDDLLARVTPEQRAILQPIPPRRPPR
jgi:ectoine hydroxylase-related dioxygenase (phytanoyl-CoA dioxygenase family)